MCSRVILHLVPVPAVADAEDEAAITDLVDGGDELGGLDRIALRDQAHACADLQGGGGHRRRGERDEGVHDIVIFLGQITAENEG
jgi:hypothetical protein